MQLSFIKDTDGSFYSLDKDNNKVPAAGVTEDTENLVICLYDETQGDAENAVSLVVKDAETGKYYKRSNKRRSSKTLPYNCGNCNYCKYGR